MVSLFIDGSQFTEIFRDDFGGTTLDRSKWQVVYGGTSSNGAFTWSHDDVSVGDGMLTLAIHNGASGWTAGGIGQGGSGETYGLYQVRAKVGIGDGVGPALLLWPASNNWPGSELDLLESPSGDRSSVYFTQHWIGAGGTNNYASKPFALDATQWHVYALDWEPGYLAYYVDGTLLLKTSVHVPTDAHWFALQGNVGSGDDNWYDGGPDATTPSTVSIDIDWVSIAARQQAVIEPAGASLVLIGLLGLSISRIGRRCRGWQLASAAQPRVNVPERY